MSFSSSGAVVRDADAVWFQGAVKLIACYDDRSTELYKAVVSRVEEVYLGAKLEAAYVPSRPRTRT